MGTMQRTKRLGKELRGKARPRVGYDNLAEMGEAFQRAGEAFKRLNFAFDNFDAAVADHSPPQVGKRS